MELSIFAQPIESQLKWLKSVGMEIQNEEAAFLFLERNGLYRLSHYYKHYFKTPKSEQFKEGTNFEKIVTIYNCDHAIRHWILDEIEHIELYIRQFINSSMVAAYGPYWIEREELFEERYLFEKNLRHLSKDYIRNDEDFIQAERDNIPGSLPPSWIALEVSSFGTLSSLFDNLKSSKEKNKIAKHFGINEKYFSSWIHSLSHVRNQAAHFTRLWNDTFNVHISIPKTATFKWLNNTHFADNRVYAYLCVIAYIRNIMDKNWNAGEDLKRILSICEEASEKAYGFPFDWTEEPIWTI